ncbi:MAG: hypothetical protein ACPGVO_20990 [Spirulinaceae cyanobacterium]
MTIEQIQTQALQLPTHQKWQLVQSLLNAIQQETQPQLVELTSETPTLDTLEPWVQNLVGVISLPDNKDCTELYTDYLEAKYR